MVSTPPDAAPAKPQIPAAAPLTATVGELLSLAREFASIEDPPMVIAAVEAHYVDADGKLDAEAGELSIVLGTAAQPADDPKRRTGAPADAVAVVQISEGLERRWLFSINDEPRNVKIQHLFADDCALAVEKP